LSWAHESSFSEVNWSYDGIGRGEDGVEVVVINPTEAQRTSRFAFGVGLDDRLKNLQRRYGSMDKRVWKILGWAVALLLVLAVGAAAGGGIVYAMTRAQRGEAPQFVGEGPLDPEPGVVIASVVSDGPADEAGVKRGDILLQVGDEPVDDAMDLNRALGEYEPGDEVALTILHGDDERTLEATLGDRDGRPYLGVVACGARVDVGRAVSVVERGPGAVIVDVEPDSPADEAGLQEGDIVVAVDGQELDSENTLADLISGYDPGDTVTLEVRRPGPEDEAEEITVELGQHPEDKGKAYLGVRYHPLPPLRVQVWAGEKPSLPFESWQRIRPFGGWDHLQLIPEGEEMQGAIIRRVEEGSPAEDVGLRKGDIITAIDGDPIEGPGDLVDTIAGHGSGDRVTLEVHRFGDDEAEEEREIEVTLAEHPDEEGKAYLGVVVGGFIHVHRSGDGEELDEFELDFNFEGKFDDLPFEFDALPEHFEFHFPDKDLDLEIPFDEFDLELDNMEQDFDFEFSFPPEYLDSVGTICCEGSI
jgi:S1-C subfamily serine protease